MKTATTKQPLILLNSLKDEDNPWTTQDDRITYFEFVEIKNVDIP